MEARIRHPRNETEDQTRFLHISWLYAQDYCEYQLYLDQVKGVTVEATQAMVEGSDEHQRLEDEFLAKSDKSAIWIAPRRSAPVLWCNIL